MLTPSPCHFFCGCYQLKIRTMTCWGSCENMVVSIVWQWGLGGSESDRQHQKLPFKKSVWKRTCEVFSAKQWCALCHCVCDTAELILLHRCSTHRFMFFILLSLMDSGHGLTALRSNVPVLMKMQLFTVAALWQKPVHTVCRAGTAVTYVTGTVFDHDHEKKTVLTCFHAPFMLNKIYCPWHL